MRSFIAIELPQETRQYLSRLQEELKMSDGDVKWVQPQNIHLTLKFLGEIDTKESEKVEKVIEEIAKDKLVFYARLCCLGAFPKINYPRVIWIGIDKGDVEIKQIAEALEEKTVTLGIPAQEKPFSSHITLGRVRSNLNRNNLIQKLQNLTQPSEQKPAEFLVKKITLFKSTLTPQGPVYEVLKEASLKIT